MQYIFKVSLSDTPLWRLTALEGKADLAHTAKLIALSYNYPQAAFSFAVRGVEYFSGFDGALTPAAALSLDALNLKAQEEFIFRVHLIKKEALSKNSALIAHAASLEDLKAALAEDDAVTTLDHQVQVMKNEEKLFCLIPSTLVGSGRLADDGRALSVESINAFLDEEDLIDTLNLKECTQRMRELGPVRSAQDLRGLELPSRLLS